MFDKKVQEMLTEIMFEEKAEEATLDLYGSADDVYGKEDYKQGFKDGTKFGYNEKYSEFENELKWERDTKTELAEHLGKANDKVADLEETINKLREQLALRYDLEDKIKELEEANKTNKWYYVKDGDLPNTECGRADVTVAYINAYENPCKMDCCFDGTNFVYWDNECTIWVKVGEIKGKVYAWKYQEKLPEIPKENE